MGTNKEKYGVWRGQTLVSRHRARKRQLPEFKNFCNRKSQSFFTAFELRTRPRPQTWVLQHSSLFFFFPPWAFLGFQEKGYMCVYACSLACLNFLLGHTFSQASALAEGWALSPGPPSPLQPSLQLEVFTDL